MHAPSSFRRDTLQSRSAPVAGPFEVEVEVQDAALKGALESVAGARITLVSVRLIRALWDRPDRYNYRRPADVKAEHRR